MKRIVALLPMKGNSERIPNKNMKLFNGKPLYHSVMKTLLSTGKINQIVVNTDSEKIKDDISINFPKRVNVIDRPEEIQGDNISMNKIIAFDIKKIPADIYIQTHSTNPLLSKETLDKAILKMLKCLKIGNYDSIFSVTRVQTRLYDHNTKPINHNPENLIMTQNLNPIFEENSNLYLFTKKSFVEAKNKRIGLNPLMLETNKYSSLDIDNFDDFRFAELLKNRNEKF